LTPLGDHQQWQGIAARMLQASGVHWEQVGDTIHISKLPEKEGSISLPTNFQGLCNSIQQARVCLKSFLNTKKKQFVDRIEQAEGETARSQQVGKTIEQLNQQRP
jgi:hypothetical protein